MKVIGSKTSFQNHQPSKLHFVSGADEKRKFCRPATFSPVARNSIFVWSPHQRLSSCSPNESACTTLLEDARSIDAWSDVQLPCRIHHSAQPYNIFLSRSAWFDACLVSRISWSRWLRRHTIGSSWCELRLWPWQHFLPISWPIWVVQWWSSSLSAATRPAVHAIPF